MKSIALLSAGARFKSWLCHGLVIQCWVSYSITLSLNLLSYKMGITIIPEEVNRGIK